MMFIFLLLFTCVCGRQSAFYDSYTGTTITEDEVNNHITRNSSFWCMLEVQKCDPYEGRRIDGTCNNIHIPTRGAAHTPILKLLPSIFDTTAGYEPRRSVSGKPLPLSRSLRTTFLAEGRVPDRFFTHLVTYLWVFLTADVVSLHNTVNYVLWKPYCCEERGKADKVCTPTEIPEDDPVHRFSGVRCTNLTRPESFQSVGCLKNDTVPERWKGTGAGVITITWVFSLLCLSLAKAIFNTIWATALVVLQSLWAKLINTASPVFDLSLIYGKNIEKLNRKARSFKGGLMKTETEKGKIFPPSTTSQANVCMLNKKPKESRCHDGPDEAMNSILGINLFSIWTWRMHNRIATVLSALNPCWDDEKLFYTARDINMAIVMQIYYYELMPALMGRENLLHSGAISPSIGFREIYNESVPPQISLEFPYVTRWAHTIQEGIVKHYDPQGKVIKEAQMVELTLRTGYLVDNLEFITQGAFRQAAAKADYTVDPDLAEIGIGGLQKVSDILTNDMQKGRYFGIPPYIKYRKLCSGRTYRTFEDLIDVIDPERIQLLKEKYESVEDIDLLAGIWLERHIPGGHIPITMYCIVVDQMARTVVSDRHWYERQHRPNAFTIDQLLEIRKANIAQFLCVVGDTVTQIQPKAFFVPGPGNELRSCDSIEKINLWAWKDYSCSNNPYTPYTI